MLIWIIEWSLANLRILIKVLFIQNINLIRSVPKFILDKNISLLYWRGGKEGSQQRGISVKILKYFHLAWSILVIISDQTFWPGEQANFHFKASKPGDHTSRASLLPSPPQYCLRNMFPSPSLSPPPPSLSKTRESMPSQYYPRYAPCSMYSPLLAVIAGIST